MADRGVARLVRAHVVRTRPRDKANLDLEDADSLVACGILDSVGVFELVAYLEQRFGIEIRDEELRWNNFETIEAITRLVESKLAAAA